MTADPVTSATRRWPRAALPFAVLFAVVATTLIAHLVERPDPTDASFLSPVSGAGDGSATLADRLRRRGVGVERAAGTPAALESLRSGPAATLLVTAPDLVHPAYLRVLTPMPTGVRIVLVAPGDRALAEAGLPVGVAGSRWATAAPEPGCADPVANAAGPAAVLRLRYAAATVGPVHCYAGGLVELSERETPVTVLGAADPLRNDRLAEHGNAALAEGLLTRTPRVVWLDLHAPEPPPAADPVAPDLPARPDDAEAGDTGTGPGSDGGSRQSGQSSERADEQSDPLADNPLLRAFPAQVWAAVLLTVLALLVLAGASARRLGAPVVEPLPVRVRATETVLGHGRLYRRARARGPSLEILRANARRRIAEQLGVAPGDTAAGLAGPVAAQTGLDPRVVLDTLDGPPPETDSGLVAAALAVQDLLRRVTGSPPPDEGKAP